MAQAKSPFPHAPARFLVLMGSGETSPTMVKVHRAVLDRLEPGPRCLFLGTPFGFQENAKELAQRTVTYFRTSLNTPIDVLDFSDTTDSASPSFSTELAHASIRNANYVFAGPGSPSYALREWSKTIVPELLADKLVHGGAVVFSSAAALTLGAMTVPVYEIYKAGEAPYWLAGLDVLSAIGMNVAVIPHYNNAEGGTHDTRFCYLGERRLSLMETMLDQKCWVLGIDEHTALVIDIEARSATVTGLGVVTARNRQRSVIFEAGTQISLDDLIQAGIEGNEKDAERGSTTKHNTSSPDQQEAIADDNGLAHNSAEQRSGVSPLVEITRRCEATFSDAIARRDANSAVEAILELETEIVAWSTDIPQQDELDRAHASLRSMIVELGGVAERGLQDPRTVIEPFVEAIATLRRQARDARRFDEADQLRDLLDLLGIELRDHLETTTWTIKSAQ